MALAKHDRFRGPGEMRSKDQQCRHHATCDHVFADDEDREFLIAMDSFQRTTGKRFPTWTDALTVFRGLGYNKPRQKGVNLFEALEAAAV